MQPVTFCVLLLTAGHVCYSQESKSGPCDLANSSALHDSALAAPEQHRYDAALLGFQRAPSAYPAQRVILGDAYFMAQRFPEARAEYERVLKVDPNQADTIEIKGNIEYLAGASEEAESTFIGLLDKHPNKVTTLRKRSSPHRKLPIETLMALRNFYLGGKALCKLQKIDLRLNWLQRSVFLDPSYPEPPYLLSKVYTQVGSEEKAKETLEKFREVKAMATQVRR